MDFPGKAQAYIIARYYVNLKECFGERGVKAFAHATQVYAEQRGHRMAQRAIRDGKELNHETYEQYRELLAGHKIDIISMAPDFIMHVKHCEWAEAFKEMGMVEAGREYCSHIDTALCRGFNPYLPYTVGETLNTGDHCYHKLSGANFTEDTDLTPVPGASRTLEYHCGNLYWVFNEICAAIFGAEGEEVGARVLREFRETYGKEMADALAGYRHVYYNICT